MDEIKTNVEKLEQTFDFSFDDIAPLSEFIKKQPRIEIEGEEEVEFDQI